MGAVARRWKRRRRRGCDWRKMLRLICFRQAPSQAKPNAAQAVVDASTKTRKAKEEERERENEDMDML